MTPENLPTIENNYKHDWWIMDKISKRVSLWQNRFLDFFYQCKFTKWWKFSLATTTIFFLAVIGFILAYQNQSFISSLFPNTSSFLTASIQRTKLEPSFFAKIQSNISARYNLSSAIISLKKIVGGDDFTFIEIDKKLDTEKPLKILIEKININASVSNPNTVDLETLNEALELGAVRYPTSGLLGEDKNIFIFGHSTSLETENDFYKTFNNLNDLLVGDIIILQSADNEYIYKITSVYLTDTDEGIVRFDENEQKLTLSTCNTLGQKEERYIVEADFIKKVTIIPTTPDANNTVSITPQAGEREDNIYDANALFTPIPETDKDNGLGQVDLVATIDAVGILGQNNEFTATSTLRVSDKIAVKFTVTNIGDKKSEGWYFNAVLPTSPSHIFHSKSQQVLAPGEKIEFVIGFDKAKIGENQIIVINVDPSGGIKESDKENNIVKEFITVIE